MTVEEALAVITQPAAQALSGEEGWDRTAEAWNVLHAELGGMEMFYGFEQHEATSIPLVQRAQRLLRVAPDSRIQPRDYHTLRTILDGLQWRDREAEVVDRMMEAPA